MSSLVSELPQLPEEQPPESKAFFISSAETGDFNASREIRLPMAAAKQRACHGEFRLGSAILALFTVGSATRCPRSDIALASSVAATAETRGSVLGMNLARECARRRRPCFSLPEAANESALARIRKRRTAR